MAVLLNTKEQILSEIDKLKKKQDNYNSAHKDYGNLFLAHSTELAALYIVYSNLNKGE